MADDRAEFEESRRRQILALGQDDEVFRDSVDLVAELDRYDYSYLWHWMGLPIIQFPADIVATQEVVWATQPDVIIETGVARGGSVVFLASLLCHKPNAKVIGVDLEIRTHNRAAIESHVMAPWIQLVEGDSVSAQVLDEVRSHVPEGARVMVILDSDHTRNHVLAECRAYGNFVTEGCFLVVADTLVGHMEATQIPTKRSRVLKHGDEPLSAVVDFLAESPHFVAAPEVNGKLVMSSSPGGYLRRVT